MLGRLILIFCLCLDACLLCYCARLCVEEESVDIYKTVNIGYGPKRQSSEIEAFFHNRLMLLLAISNHHHHHREYGSPRWRWQNKRGSKSSIQIADCLVSLLRTMCIL